MNECINFLSFFKKKSYLPQTFQCQCTLVYKKKHVFYMFSIRMISEGSCDTEDLSNDAENSAFITEIRYILKYITIEKSYFNL